MERTKVIGFFPGNPEFKIVGADILNKSMKRLRVVLDGTDFPLTLTRPDTRVPYTGSQAGVDFESDGIEE